MEIKDIISSGILELYAAELTSAEENMQVQSWLKQYPEVAEELKAIELSLESYAQSSAITPNESVKEKLFANIKTPITPVINIDTNNNFNTKVVSLNNKWKWAAAASAALLIGSVALNFSYYNKYEIANKNLKKAQENLASAKQQSNELKNDLEIVHNPLSVPVSLNGLPALPNASAKIFWMKNTGDVMIDASNLPDAPAGKQYQFWGIVNGVPVDGGLIITTDKGKKFRMQKMRSFGKAEAFAISLEKEGGNPTPTEVVSLGKII